MAAARGGALVFLKQLLDQGEDVNARSSAGLTALHEACLENRIEAARLLLSRGADINVATTRTGMTPLMIAVDKVTKDDTLLKELLRRKPQVNQQSNEGWTALSLACDNGHEDYARILLNNNADPNLPRNDGTMPLMMAVNKNSLDIVQMLVKRGAKVNAARPSDGMTALAFTCLTGNVEIARWLLENSADPNAKLKDGTSLVQLAQAKNNPKILQLISDFAAKHKR